VTSGLAFLNSKNGTFASVPGARPFAGDLLDVKIGDRTRDGIPDLLFVAEFDNRSSGTVLARGVGNGTFDFETVNDLEGVVQSSIVDMNGDGELDVLVVLPSVEQLSVHVGRPCGFFQLPRILDLPPVVRLSELVTPDLNGDGLPDLLYTHFEDLPEEPPVYFLTVTVNLTVAPEASGCNRNGTADVCEIEDQPSLDVGADGVLDRCDVDCNLNNVPDDSEAPSTDCDGNGIDDGCDIAFGRDSDGNTFPDACDIASAPELDCDGNGFLDSFDIASDARNDCNGNNTLDSCDIASGMGTDCDENGILDECDLRVRPSLDGDRTGVLDICEVVAGFDVGGRPEAGVIYGRPGEEVIVKGTFQVFSSISAGGWIMSMGVSSPENLEYCIDLLPTASCDFVCKSELLSASAGEDLEVLGLFPFPTVFVVQGDDFGCDASDNPPDSVGVNAGMRGFIDSTVMSIGTTIPVDTKLDFAPFSIRVTVPESEGTLRFECIDALGTVGQPIRNGLSGLGSIFAANPCLREVRIAPGNVVPGDCNFDGAFDITDVICVLGFVLISDSSSLGCGDGTVDDPANLVFHDWQSDGQIDISDGIGGLLFLFRNGPAHPLNRSVLGGGCTQVAGCPALPAGLGCPRVADFPTAPSTRNLEFRMWIAVLCGLALVRSCLPSEESLRRSFQSAMVVTRFLTTSFLSVLSVAFWVSAALRPCWSDDETPALKSLHWAFRPVAKVELPAVKDPNWPRTAVDPFLLHHLEQSRLEPRPDTDRYTWLRRVSFDLTGLPPTVEEISAFENDVTPVAYERVVDRLLSSHAFGERWARHWMDLVGYADELGTSNGVFARYAWKYRDYLIDSFNTDRPFDRFIREQIAGDLLPYDSIEERQANLTATGFLVLGDLQVVEADKEKLRVDIIDQQLDKVGKAFLGMSFHCARCHDHKFDPVAQRDYYAMAGFFHSTQSIFKTERGVWSDVVVVELPETEVQKAERVERALLNDKKIARFKEESDKHSARKAEVEKLVAQDSGNKELVKERDELAKRIGELQGLIVHAQYFAPDVPRVQGVRDVTEPSDMRITVRGDPHQLGDSVPRGFLQVLAREPVAVPPNQSGRRDFADWIASTDNPLTARVIVNRIWQKLFGAGLVSSVDNFGVRGGRPSHPDLLDFLAGKFIAERWSTKRLIRLLVLSRAYGMESSHDEQAAERDPDNKSLWRMNSRRLEAEAIRDALFVVSGDLDRTVGKPAFAFEFPENSGGFTDTVNTVRFGLARWRPEQPYQRTLYLPVVRQGSQPDVAEIRNVFDFKQPADYGGERAATAVATQALFLMNGPAIKQHADRLARALERDSDDAAIRLESLWLRVFNRPITAAERGDAEVFVSAAESRVWEELCHALLMSNEFLMRR
jgi:hypothetical protein